MEKGWITDVPEWLWQFLAACDLPRVEISESRPSSALGADASHDLHTSNEDDELHI